MTRAEAELARGLIALAVLLAILVVVGEAALRWLE